MADREVQEIIVLNDENHQRIIDEANENPAEQTANILDACSDEKLKKVEARISELSQNDEEIYNQVDELLIKISTSMLMGDDRGTMTSYKELDDLLSKVDNTPDGKDKHLKALEAYKEFLEKCKLKERNDELAKVEARISELRQDDEEKQDNEEIYKQFDELLIKLATSQIYGDDRETMALYKKLDDLLLNVDNTPDGKDKHLKALEAYKEFLEKCKLKERDDELTKVEARISELRQDDEEKQNNEEIYKQVDQILIDITTFTMLNNDTLTMAAYKKLDNLLSKVDNTPDGKNKHLIALRYYKEFLEKCKLKERDEELMRVENLITKLSQE